MSASAYTAEIRRRLTSSVELIAIGNSNRGMKDIAIDLINQSDLDYETIADRCFLSKSTIKNLATEKTRRPQAETIERIFRCFDLRMKLNGEVIRGRYLNKAKEK